MCGRGGCVANMHRLGIINMVVSHHDRRQYPKIGQNCFVQLREFKTFRRYLTADVSMLWQIFSLATIWTTVTHSLGAYLSSTCVSDSVLKIVQLTLVQTHGYFSANFTISRDWVKIKTIESVIAALLLTVTDGQKYTGTPDSDSVFLCTRS